MSPTGFLGGPNLARFTSVMALGKVLCIDLGARDEGLSIHGAEWFLVGSEAARPPTSVYGADWFLAGSEAARPPTSVYGADWFLAGSEAARPRPLTCKRKGFNATNCKHHPTQVARCMEVRFRQRAAELSRGFIPTTPSLKVSNTP
jgi:hypothetical protein